ncbi:MAG: lipopolysaccharide heptosyltransferase I [Deltaproteobacteria bacterium]|jgi:heptosyltransferase-1|nr:lipopolysaccharide heptosyltransferase I [Deltaproteobacteria bacterium]
MKVLIVKVSALGDVIHALPVLALIKSADKQIRIDWLVEESFADVLADHPLINTVHRINTKQWRRAGVLTSLRNGWRSIQLIRAESYDVVLDLQGNAKSGLFTWCSGAPLRFGFDRNALREKISLVSTNRKVGLTDADFHITDRSLAIAKAAFPNGHDLKTAGPLPVDSNASQDVKSMLEEEGLSEGGKVVLHYGTTWTTKLWSLELWMQLAKTLKETYRLRPILTWGNDEEYAAVQAINEYCDGTCVVWPRRSLKHLIALMSQVDLVIGGDTGPIHIAAAVGTRTVSIFRVTDASRNAPRGSRHIALQSGLDCAPCLKKSCELDAQCAQSITADQVVEAVSQNLRAAGVME